MGVGCVLPLWFYVQKQKSARVLHDTINQRAQLTELQASFGAALAQVEELKQQLTQAQEALHVEYVAKGLSADEITDRFRRIAL